MSGNGDHVQSGASEASGSVRPPPILREVYREHRPFVYRIVRQLGVEAREAEDVVHDVFVVVGAKLDDYEGRGTLRSWLYGITRRVVLHHHRGERRTRRRLELVAGGVAVEPPPPTVDPEAELARAEAARTVREFADGLSTAKREVFVLALVEGLPAPAIADATGVNLNTIYARIRSVRRAFERMIKRRRLTEGGSRWSR